MQNLVIKGDFLKNYYNSLWDLSSNMPVLTYFVPLTTLWKEKHGDRTGLITSLD